MGPTAPPRISLLTMNPPPIPNLPSDSARSTWPEPLVLPPSSDSSKGTALWLPGPVLSTTHFFSSKLWVSVLGLGSLGCGHLRQHSGAQSTASGLAPGSPEFGESQVLGSELGMLFFLCPVPSGGCFSLSAFSPHQLHTPSLCYVLSHRDIWGRKDGRMPRKPAMRARKCCSS